MKILNDQIDKAMELEEMPAQERSKYPGTLEYWLSYALHCERLEGKYDGSYSEAVNALEIRGYDVSERGAK